jgi:mono/diheme cytochrome c family protein
MVREERMMRRTGLLVLLLAAAGCHGRYIRSVTADPIAPDPDRLVRGSYLVNQVLACGACHTSRAHGDILTEPERTDAFLGGGNTYVDKAMGTLWIPNITPDPETGVGRWKDDELLRALRDGVAPDAHFLAPLMPYGSYQHLSDEDARAVVAYLRSVPPHRLAKPRQDNRLGFMPRLMFNVIGVQMHNPVVSVAAPDRGNKIEYGHYLVRIAACTDCHSLAQKGPRPETDPLYLAGSEGPWEDPSIGKVYARNLTGDADTGLGRYDAAAIKAAMRNGTRLDGKRLAPPMSTMMPHYTGMTDEDLDAIAAYLKTLPAAKHRVPERELVEPLRGTLGG